MIEIIIGTFIKYAAVRSPRERAVRGFLNFVWIFYWRALHMKRIRQIMPAAKNTATQI